MHLCWFKAVDQVIVDFKHLPTESSNFHNLKSSHLLELYSTITTVNINHSLTTFKFYIPSICHELQHEKIAQTSTLCHKQKRKGNEELKRKDQMNIIYIKRTRLSRPRPFCIDASDTLHSISPIFQHQCLLLCNICSFFL